MDNLWNNILNWNNIYQFVEEDDFSFNARHWKKYENIPLDFNQTSISNPKPGKFHIDGIVHFQDNFGMFKITEVSDQIITLKSGRNLSLINYNGNFKYLRPKLLLNYNKAIVKPTISTNNANKIIGAMKYLLLNPSQSNVLVIGGAFGWSVEVLMEKKIRAIHTDTSSLIHSLKYGTEKIDLLTRIHNVGLDQYEDEDGNILIQSLYDNKRRSQYPVYKFEVLYDEDRKAIKSKMRNVDVIITENFLNNITDQEAYLLANNMRMVAPHVIHLISPNQALITNGNTFEDWKKLLPTDYFINTDNKDFNII